MTNICVTCGTIFNPKDSRKKYCCKKCIPIWNKGKVGLQKSWNKLSKEKEDEIIKWYKKDYSYREIADKLGYTYNTPFRVLKRRGIKARPKSIYKRTKSIKEKISKSVKKIAKRGKDNPAYIDGLAQRRKNYKRKNMGCVKILDNFYPKSIEIEYHHINDLFVIPFPKITHTKLFNKNQKIHRKKCNDFIKNKLGINIESFLNTKI